MKANIPILGVGNRKFNPSVFLGKPVIDAATTSDNFELHNGNGKQHESVRSIQPRTAITTLRVAPCVMWQSPLPAVPSSTRAPPAERLIYCFEVLDMRRETVARNRNQLGVNFLWIATLEFIELD